MTDIAVTSPIERIARVLVAYRMSANAEGDEEGIAHVVDDAMRDELMRAQAILRTLREPTEAMVAAGNAARGDAAEVWSAMVNAALDSAKASDTPAGEGALSSMG